MDLEAIIHESWSTAERSGWHKQVELGLIPEKLLMLTTEISEAVEEYRVHGLDQYLEDGTKPCGFMSELSDVLIRLGDLIYIAELEDRSGKHSQPFMEVLRAKMAYNKTRPQRHGGKRL